MVLQTTTFDHSVTATNWSTRRESNPHPSGQGWRNLPRRFTTRLNFSQPLQWSSDFIRLNMRLLTTVLRPLSPLQRWLDFIYLKCKWQSKCPYYCLTPLITVSGYLPWGGWLSFATHGNCATVFLPIICIVFKRNGRSTVSTPRLATHPSKCKNVGWAIFPLY